MTINKCCSECGVPYKGNDIEYAKYSKQIGDWVHEECHRQIKERFNRMNSDPNNNRTDITFNMALEAVAHKHIEKYNTILAKALWRSKH